MRADGRFHGPHLHFTLPNLCEHRPYVEDFSPMWLAGSTCALTAGSMALIYISHFQICVNTGRTSRTSAPCGWQAVHAR